MAIEQNKPKDIQSFSEDIEKSVLYKKGDELYYVHGAVTHAGTKEKLIIFTKLSNREFYCIEIDTFKEHFIKYTK